MGVAMVTGVAVAAVVQHQFDVVAPALVGLTVAYALSVTGLLSGVVSAFTETEREFIALERVSQYIDAVEPEVNGLFDVYLDYVPLKLLYWVLLSDKNNTQTTKQSWCSFRKPEIEKYKFQSVLDYYFIIPEDNIKI